MNDWIVAKFGGSSVRDAKAMYRCVEIVKNHSEIRVVILSATYKTTNMLEQMANFAVDGDSASAFNCLQELKEKHHELADELDSNDDVIQGIDDVFSEAESLIKGIILLKECSPRALDRIYSLGERISSALFTGALNSILEGERDVTFFDVRKILKTNSDFGKARPDIKAIKAKTEEFLLPFLENEDGIIVTQGFIGSDSEGATTTLGREGSDFTGALISEAIDAKLLQIWTDVPGIATTDPKLIAHACIIPEMTYEEASSMAHLGAKILFPKTLTPLIRKSIPLFVGSSLDFKSGGTWVRESVDKTPYLRGLAVLDQQILTTVTSQNIIPINIFFKSILEILHQYNVSYDSINFDGNNISFVMTEPAKLTDEVCDVISKIADVISESGLSKISVIGNRMDEATHLIAEIFQSLSKGAIRTIQLGSSAHSLSILVTKSESPVVLKELHDHLLDYAMKNGFDLKVVTH